jgi:hypothetical protein
MRGWVVLVTVLLLASPARAQSLGRGGDDDDTAELDELMRWAKQVKLRLTVFGVGDGTPGLEGDTRFGFGARFELHPGLKSGRVAVGFGRDGAFALRFDARIEYERGAARSRVRIDLAVADRKLSFSLPDVRLSASDVYGRTAFEATVPIIEGRF